MNELIHSTVDNISFIQTFFVVSRERQIFEKCNLLLAEWKCYLSWRHQRSLRYVELACCTQDRTDSEDVYYTKLWGIHSWGCEGYVVWFRNFAFYLHFLLCKNVDYSVFVGIQLGIVFQYFLELRIMVLLI